MTRCPVCFSRNIFPACPDIAEIKDGIGLVEVMEYELSCGECNCRWKELFKKVGEEFIGFGTELPKELPKNYGRSVDA